MKMKTSPNDVSNQEILKAIDRLNDKIDTTSLSLNDKIDGVSSSLNNKIDGIHKETLEAIHVLSDMTDARFDRLEGRMGGLEGRMGGVEVRLNRVEANMVTKDYLDDKLANQYSDIVRHTKKEIEKALN